MGTLLKGTHTVTPNSLGPVEEALLPSHPPRSPPPPWAEPVTSWRRAGPANGLPLGRRGTSRTPASTEASLWRSPRRRLSSIWCSTNWYLN